MLCSVIIVFNSLNIGTEADIFLCVCVEQILCLQIAWVDIILSIVQILNV